MTNIAHLFYYPTAFGLQAKEIVNWNNWNSSFSIFNVVDLGLKKLDECIVNTNQRSSSSRLLEFGKAMWFVPAATATLGALVQTVSLLTQHFPVLPDLEYNQDEETIVIPVNAYSIVFNLTSWAAILGTGYAAYRISKLANAYFGNEEDINQLVNDLPENKIVAFCHPQPSFFEENLLVVRIACGVVACALNPLSVLNALNLISETMALKSLAGKQWIQFQIEVPSHYEEIKSIICKIVIGLHKVNDLEQCSICLDSLESQIPPISKAYVLSCHNGHAFHLKCLAQNIITHMENLEKAFCNPLVKEKNPHNFSGLGRSLEFSTEIDREKLPNCPLCRCLPPYSINAELLTDENERFPLNITLKKFSP